jgi:diacylglycerol kinase family enzyme
VFEFIFNIGDGSFDVILVKRSWRMGLLRFLTNVANDGRSIDDLSNVERYRATQIIINPIIDREQDLGNWSCDGELIQAKQVTIRAHRQILTIFASGINIEQINRINQLKS